MNKKNQKKGFTLIELLVAIAIVGLIATVTVVNFRAGQQRDELELAARQVQSNIENARIASLSGELVEGDIPRGGYGLRFDSNSNSYIYFADINEDFLRQSGEDKDIRNYTLPAGITFVSPSADIVFDPPRPDIYINGNKQTNEITLELRHEAVEESRIVTINRISGRIDIK